MIRRVQPAAQLTDVLAPAWVVYLLTGVKTYKLPGGWHLFQAFGDRHRGQSPDPIDVGWQEHRAALTQVAAEAGFRPARALKPRERWTAAEVEAERRWRERFIALHRVSEEHV
jgi:hypothetical protein